MSDTAHTSIPNPHTSGPDRSSAPILDDSLADDEFGPAEGEDYDLEFGEEESALSDDPRADTVSDPRVLTGNSQQAGVSPAVNTPVPAEAGVPTENSHSEGIAPVAGPPVQGEVDAITGNSQKAEASPVINSPAPAEAGVLTENSYPEEEAYKISSPAPGGLEDPNENPHQQGVASAEASHSPSEIGFGDERSPEPGAGGNIDLSLPSPPRGWLWRQPEAQDRPAGAMPTRDASDQEPLEIGDPHLDDVDPQDSVAEHPAPDQITLPFYVHTANGEVTADYVAYRKNSVGFYEIDPSDMERDEVKGYLQKGLISGRLACKSLAGQITPVEAGTQSASDFMAQQADYYSCNEEERKLRPWPVLDPETTKFAPASSAAAQPSAAPDSPPGGELPTLETKQEEKTVPRRLKTEGERLLAVLDLTLTSHKSAAIKEITASERARFLDIRHTPRKEVSRRAGVKIGILGRVRLAASAALRSSSKDDPKSLSERASSLGRQTTIDIGNVRHISATVTPNLRNAILSYESTAKTINNGIQSLNITVSQHPDFPKLTEAVSECMAALSSRGGPRITADMVISAANDSSLSLPALEKVRENAKAILESNPDLMLISTSTNLLAQKLARHSREIGQGIIGLKQSGLPESELKKIEGALLRFHESTANISPSITPNSGTNLLRETLSYMRDMSTPESLSPRPDVPRPSIAPLEHHAHHDPQVDHDAHPEP